MEISSFLWATPNTGGFQPNTLHFLMLLVAFKYRRLLYNCLCNLTFVLPFIVVLNNSNSNSKLDLNSEFDEQGDEDEYFCDSKEEDSNFVTSISPPTAFMALAYKDKSDLILNDIIGEFDSHLQSQFNAKLLYKESKYTVIEPSICETRFLTVQGHRPSKINHIPWKLMKEEWWRLHTFSKYPRNAPCSAIVLARQGFVYIGKGNANDDTVICVFCLCAVKDLDAMDIESQHRKLNPNCPIVRHGQCENILIKVPDRRSSSDLFSLLNSHQQNEYSYHKTKDSQQNENEISHLEMDFPDTFQPPVNSPVSSREAAPATSISHLLCDNTPPDPRFQAAVDASSSAVVVVTNHASSLSTFPGQVEADGNPAQNTDNGAEQSAAVGAAAKPNNIPSSTSAPKTSSNQSAHRNGNNGSSNNHQSHSESSRPQPYSNPPNTTANTPNYPRNPDNPQTSTPQTVGDNAQPAQGTAASYEKLGLITARPKRYEYAVEVTRLQSYDGWPEGHHIKKEDLAKAGFYYTGYSDCARCFYCGGGLRNWEVGDDVWVEHARWFAKCAFIRQCVGQPFIDVVQELGQERETIPYEDVITEMEARHLQHSIPKGIKDKTELERDPAVTTIIDNGFSRDDVIKAAEALKDTGMLLAADAIYDELKNMNAKRTSEPRKGSGDSMSVKKKGTAQQNKITMQSLKDENSQLRQQSQCKICMDKEVSMVFLPCGHFISCNDCSFALKSCPVCRDGIRACVRAYLN